MLQGLAVLAFVAVYFFALPFPLIIVAAGVIGFLGGRAGSSVFTGGDHKGIGSLAGSTRLGEETPDHARPSLAAFARTVALWLPLWLAPVVALLALASADIVFSHIAVFQHYHWLQPREMLDGLGMAETTPGPLIMVLQFVGFMAAFRAPGSLPPLLAGALGGLLATWVTFVPCFLWIFAGAPFIERLRNNNALSGALSAITAVVVGVILNLAVWFAVHTIFREVWRFTGFGLTVDVPKLASVDPLALLLSVAAAIAVFRFKTGMLQTLAGCALGGVVFYLAGVLPALTAS